MTDDARPSEDRLREAAKALLAAVEPVPLAVGMRLMPRVGSAHATVIELRAALAASRPAPDLTAENVGRIVDEHYLARREADPKGPPLHECGSYCGADIAARLLVR